jgi:hypothetical protein
MAAEFFWRRDGFEERSQRFRSDGIGETDSDNVSLAPDDARFERSHLIAQDKDVGSRRHFALKFKHRATFGNIDNGGRYSHVAVYHNDAPRGGLAECFATEFHGHVRH